MEPFTIGYLLVGILLISVALTGSAIRRMPLTASMLYVSVGFGVATAANLGYGLNVVRNAEFWERLSELAVVVSLFTVGSKLAIPLRDPLWRPALRLATLSMLLTIALICLAGIWMGLPLGASVLLGAVLAPTDPVLASDVQVEGDHDRDELRVSLTAEAGLNDGTAFPFVMLAIILSSESQRENWFLHWLAVDLVWAIAVGLTIGALFGYIVGTLARRVEQKRREALGFEEFLALGLVGLAYGAAVSVHAYGFLAVFAAGLFFRRGAVRDNRRDQRSKELTREVSGFNEQVEKLLEVFALLLLGGAFAKYPPTWQALLFAGGVLFVIRPIAVYLGLAGLRLPPWNNRLAAWFGVRGIGSLYYLSFALGYEALHPVANLVTSYCLTTVLLSIVLHGLSVTPLMRAYSTRLASNRKPAF